MQVKVGTAEVEPGWLDLQASVGKTILSRCSKVRENKGCQYSRVVLNMGPHIIYRLEIQ